MELGTLGENPDAEIKEEKINYQELLDEELATGSFSTPLTGRKVRFVKVIQAPPSKAKYVVDETATKPSTQLDLKTEELEQLITRELSIDTGKIGDRARDSSVYFSFKDRKFVPKQLDQPPHIHFDLKGNSLHKDSYEAAMYEQEVKEVARMKCRPTKSNITYMDEYIDTDGEKKYRLLMNKFNFTERYSQTFSLSKNAETNTPVIEKVNFSDQVTQDYIFNVYAEDYKIQEKEMLKSSKIARYQALKRQNKGALASRKAVTMEERLLDSGFTLECMIIQNNCEDVIHDFKYFEDPADIDKEEGSILPLWKFSNELIKKKCVTAISWHPTHISLFAIGIGSYDINVVSNGYIMLFSLKNPLFYYMKFNNDNACMSLDWHHDYPYLLVAGFYRGAVQIFDLRTDSNKIEEFVFEEDTPMHHGPVWQVKWHTDTVEGYRIFYSVSGDGKFLQWILKKNKLFSTVILEMNQLELNTRFDLLQPLNAGTCFDMNTKPDDIYLVGTEMGQILEYSINYTSVLHTVFDAHAAAVYSVKWNPYFKKVFLSCSPDWTVKVWDHRYKDPVFVFDLGSPVADCEWSTHSSAVFAAITTDGTVFIYDLATRANAPMCRQDIFLSDSLKKKTKLTKVAFNALLPIVLISDDKGNIYSFKLSPNLLAQKNERRPFKINIIKRENYEVAKLSAIIRAVVNTTDNEKVNTSRKHFDYVEIRRRTVEEEMEEEKNKAKTLAQQMAKKNDVVLES